MSWEYLHMKEALRFGSSQLLSTFEEYCIGSFANLESFNAECSVRSNDVTWAFSHISRMSCAWDACQPLQPILDAFRHVPHFDDLRSLLVRGVERIRVSYVAASHSSPERLRLGVQFSSDLDIAADLLEVFGGKDMWPAGEPGLEFSIDYSANGDLPPPSLRIAYDNEELDEARVGERLGLTPAALRFVRGYPRVIIVRERQRAVAAYLILSQDRSAMRSLLESVAAKDTLLNSRRDRIRWVGVPLEQLFADSPTTAWFGCTLHG